MTVTVNGMALAKYIGEEEKVNSDLLDKKSKEIQEFIVFELRYMKHPGQRLVAASRQLAQKEAA